MSTFNGDPWEALLSSEPASPADITIMEQLACELVSDVPVEIVRRYERSIPGIARVEFKMVELLEEDSIIELTSIAIGAEEEESAKFELVFGADNALIGWHYSDLAQLKAAAGLASDMLESGELNRREEALVRHMRHLAFIYNGEVIPEDVNLMLLGTSMPRLVTDTIRELIEIIEPPAIQLREFGHAFDAEHTLQVIEHTVRGVVDPIHMLDMAEEPRLQIEYQDRVLQRNHCYIATFGNQLTLEDYDPADLLEELLGGDEDEQRFVEDSDSAVKPSPSRAGVEMLTQHIIDAMTAKLITTDFNDISSITAAGPNSIN